MNEPEPNPEEMERWLRQIKPVAPATELMTRLKKDRRGIERDIRQERAASNWGALWWRVFAPMAAAAAVVALGVVVWHQHRAAPGDRVVKKVSPPSDPMAVAADLQLRKVKSANYLLGEREEGIVETPQGDPYRVVRTLRAQQDVWVDENGTRVEKTVPEENVFLIRMEVY